MYASSMGRPDPYEELVHDVVRLGGYVAHVRLRADKAGVGGSLLAELDEMAERMSALHLVALVIGGWCASGNCGAELTDPARSRSGARHCRRCRVGWILVEDQ